MATTRARLYHAEGQITIAMASVEADTGGSPILVIAMKEFVDKSKNALCALNCADGNLFDLIIELMQGAENVRYELNAAKGLASETRQYVLDACKSIVVVKCGCGS